MFKQIKYDMQLYRKDKYYPMMCLAMFVLGIIFTFLTTSSSQQYTLIQTSIFQNFDYTIYLDYYIIVLPLIVSIPVVNVIRSDQKVGLMIRVRSKIHINYYISKIITAFFFGFLLSAIFLFSMIFFTVIYFTGIYIDYSDFSHLTAGNSHTITSTIYFVDLYTMHPILFLIVSSLIICLFSGFYAVLTMLITLLVKHNQLIPYVFVFVLEIINLYFCEFFLSSQYHILSILLPVSRACQNTILIMIFYIIFFIISSLIILMYLYAGDIYE